MYTRGEVCWLVSGEAAEHCVRLRELSHQDAEPSEGHGCVWIPPPRQGPVKATNKVVT